MIYAKTIPSPLGKITIASDGESLAGLWIQGQKHFGCGVGEMIPRELPIFDKAERWLARYFAGDRPDPKELPLNPNGTPFQRTVWAELEMIPYGHVTTYGAIAKAIGCKSAQAVGGAVGRNPISIIIPCHRVVGSGGQLTGYDGGLDRKRFLLQLENEQA